MVYALMAFPNRLLAILYLGSIGYEIASLRSQ